MKYVLSLALLLLACMDAAAQIVEPMAPPKREFRGAWIATVTNLDWPKSTDPAVQRQELVTMLDQLREAGINAVVFQVRPEADALYASSYEPWSRYLTGEQGRAPQPFYDPLEFAVQEAHARGMELHAWFNPYRAERSIGGYPLDPSHVAVEHPEWTLTIGTLRILDPGKPEVRDYNTGVIMDVVRHYDVDGVHFDDYFYPYPPNQISNEDDATFAAHGRGFTNRGDWRRDNINLFVEQVFDSIQAVKPHVKFGISPFGIWKNGVPTGTNGMDAYNVIYADAVTWLQREIIDYVTPQLYWPFGGGQDFGRLVTWWESVSSNRHLYTGHGLYRADSRTFANTLFSASEIPNQIRHQRLKPVEGSVFFRAQNLTTYNSKGIRDTLRTDLYRNPALPPVMAWKETTAPLPPEALAETREGDGRLRLSWRAPAPAADGDTAAWYAVYRFEGTEPLLLPLALDDSEGLHAVVHGDTTFLDEPNPTRVYRYVVTALDRNWNESGPSNVVQVVGVAVATEGETPAAFSLDQNYPNPFNPSTQIRFTLERPARVSLHVYTVLGQRVRTLLSGAETATGAHAVEWDGTSDAGLPLGSGTYLYVLESDGLRRARAMVLVR